jgi:hypothetical protein
MFDPMRRLISTALPSEAIKIIHFSILLKTLLGKEASRHYTALNLSDLNLLDVLGNDG